MFIFNVCRLYGIQYFGMGQVFLVNMRVLSQRINEIMNIENIRIDSYVGDDKDSE